MPTILEVAKQVVEGAIDLSEYDEQTISEIYNIEYGWRGLSPASCCDYLRGMPSSCLIPHWNCEIIELLAAHGIFRKTDDGNIKLVEQYWHACGCALFQLIESGK